MKRIVIIYNPRSTHHESVQRNVIDKARCLRGVMLAKYEVADTDVDDNTAKLAKIISDGDFVIAAGGDGTANIALNGIIASGAQKVRLAVLGFGNFNDTARTFGDLKFDDISNSKVAEYYPLECKVNGRHWRYAMCYVTAGMFAEACAVFDHPKTRKKLKKGGKKIGYSIRSLTKWWMKKHRRNFLPEFSLVDSSDESVQSNGASDYMAINGLSVAKIMKGGKWYEGKENFLSYHGKMTKFFKLIRMMMKSMFKQVPGMESDYDRLVFDKPVKVMLQAEGEYKMLENVETIEVRKAAQPIYAVVKK